MIERIQADLKEIFKNDKTRLTHIEGVLSTALKLGERFGIDETKLKLAALLHDITKNEPLSFHETLIKKHFDAEILKTYTEPLYHAFSAAVIAKETYGIEDEEILEAIKHHTIGKPAMRPIEKVLFISDYIEPNRPYAASKTVRQIAFDDIDYAVYKALDNSIELFASTAAFIPKLAYDTKDYYEWLCDIQPQFTTERLTARFVKPHDAPLFTSWWNDGRLMASVGFKDGIGIKESQVEKQFESMMTDKKGHKILIVEEKSDKTPIGEVSYGELSVQDKSLRIGIKIANVDRQNQGYGFEVLNGFFTFLYERYHLEKIYIDTLAENKRAIRLYQKLGATLTETKKGFWKDPEGTWRDAVFFELPKSNFTGGTNEET